MTQSLFLCARQFLCSVLSSASIGRSGSGKTQLALSAAVSAAWAGRKVLFVDTANGLNIHRIDQLVNLRAVR